MLKSLLLNIPTVEKTDFIRFLYKDAQKVLRKTYVKPYKSSYHWKVDVPATPTQ